MSAPSTKPVCVVACRSGDLRLANQKSHPLSRMGTRGSIMGDLGGWVGFCGCGCGCGFVAWWVGMWMWVRVCGWDGCIDRLMGKVGT